MWKCIKDGLIYIDPRGKDPKNFGILRDNNDSNQCLITDKSKRKKIKLVDRDCVWHKDDPNINYMQRY